jgi:predicted PurR-regulated permease PerM
MNQPTYADNAAMAVQVAALLLVLQLGLLDAVIAGLAAFVIFDRTIAAVRRRLPGRKAKLLAMLLALLMIAAAIFALLEAVEALVGPSGDLAHLMRLLADGIDRLRGIAPEWLGSKLPSGVDELRFETAMWLRAHSHQLQRWGMETLRVTAHVLVGLVVGALVALSAPPSSSPSPSSARFAPVQRRLAQLAAAFGEVVSAQIRISAINTGLTAVLLLLVFPLLGWQVPAAYTLLVLTFIASLIPIVGNLIANTGIVLASLMASIFAAATALVFLVVVHKLEYFLNAHLIGRRTRIPAYLLLAAMLVLEAAFGLAGVVAAPIACAWLARELRGESAEGS